MGANAYESIQEIKTLIEHKLDLASINYNNNITLNQATYLLNQLNPNLITEEDVENYEGEDEIIANEVTIPTYEAGVDNLPSNFQKYINFLKNVISNAGYNITPQGNENFGLTSLINRIKFTPDIELSYVNDEEDEDTVILTATVTLNSEPLFGLPVSFYDVNDNLVGNSVTNSDGECSVSVDVSNVVKFYSLYSGDDDYSNVSSTNINTNLFYQNPCNTSNRLNEFTTPDDALLTYNKTENAYEITHLNNSQNVHFPITQCTNFITYNELDQLKINCEVKPTKQSTGATNYRTGIYLKLKTYDENPDTYTEFRVVSSSKALYPATTTAQNYSGYNNLNDWLKIETIITFDSPNYWTEGDPTSEFVNYFGNINVYDTNNPETPIKTETISFTNAGMIMENICYFELGLFSYKSYPVYVRNIELEKVLR